MAGAAMAAGTRSLGPMEAGAQAPAMASREDGSSARLPGRSSGGQEGAGGPIGGRMARRSGHCFFAEGALRFSERDCEASSLPNPLEADFRRCSLLLPMLSSIPNLLEML